MKKFFAVLLFAVAMLSLLGISSPAFEEPPYVKSSEGVASLDGKTVMMVGNSMLYYGNCTLFNKQGEEDNGYFKQLTKINNENTSVIDMCYSGKTLAYIYENYLVSFSAEKRAEVDYVVLSEHSEGSEDLQRDVGNIMALFPENTRFYFVCHPMIYENDVRNVIEKLEELRKMGVEIVNWGKLVYDIYTGETPVPYALKAYARSTFLKDNVGSINGTGAVKAGSNGDRKHPNLLSGYITALSLYTAMTNRSAVIQEYEFTNDKTIHKYYNYEAFKAAHYNGAITTNFDEVFTSAYDMAGLQRLINEYNEDEGRHALTLYEKGERKNCTSYRTTDSYICACCAEIIAPHREISAEPSHIMEYEEGYSASCTEDGKTAHYRCINEDCEFISSDAAGEIPLETAVIKATGHKLEKVPEVKATCENDGNIYHFRCINKNCRKCFSDINGTSEISDVTLYSTGHSLVYNKKVSPTCTESGSKAHYSCTNENCTFLFTDKKGRNQIIDVYIAPKGHSETVLSAVAQTCVETGLTEGLICTVCEKVTCSQNVIKKNPHTYEVVVKGATLKKAGSKTNMCTVCGKVKSTTTLSKIKSVTLKSNTFTYDGKVKSVIVTVKNEKNKKLKNGTDYDLQYLTDSKTSGVHKVKVMFKGNYSGSKTLSYKIVPGAVSGLTAEPKHASLKARWTSAAGASAYKVELYSVSGTLIKTGYTTKNTYNFKKLTANTSYKIKVTAYKKADGKKYYSLSSKSVTAKTLL